MIYISTIGRLELANLWSWRLGGLWEVATTLVAGGRGPISVNTLLVSSSWLLLVTIGFIGFYLGDVGSSMDPWIQYLHTNTRLWLCLRTELRVSDLSMLFRLGARLRTRELFSPWATDSCRESAGVAGELFNLCSAVWRFNPDSQVFCNSWTDFCGWGGAKRSFAQQLHQWR